MTYIGGGDPHDHYIACYMSLWHTVFDLINRRQLFPFVWANKLQVYVPQMNLKASKELVYQTLSRSWAIAKAESGKRG